MNLCAPALIYLVFSITQIIIDTFKGFYNTALMKFVVMIMVTLLLNALCQQGLNIVSWFIVFIPFIFMTFIVSLLLYIFGLDASTGKLKVACSNCETDGDNQGKQTGVSYLGQIDKTGNIIFINPSSSSSSPSSSSSSSSTDITTSPNFYTPPIFNTKNVVAASSIPGFDRLI